MNPDARCEIYIRQNGVTKCVSFGEGIKADDGDETLGSASCLLQLAAGDKVYVTLNLIKGTPFITPSSANYFIGFLIN